MMIIFNTETQNEQLPNPNKTLKSRLVLVQMILCCY